MDYRTKKRRSEGGQAVVLVSLGLIAMCGMMGLAVDLGWSFFMRQSEQAAADAASLAAVRQEISSGCPYAAPCTANTTLATQYAQNTAFGFSQGGDNGHQSVTVTSGTGAPSYVTNLDSCGTTPCAVAYVSVTISDSVPQLFSAVLGHPLASVGVRSTSVVAKEVVNGSLVLSNRRNDAAPSDILPTGTDLYLGNNGFCFFGFFCFNSGFGLQANGGIVLSSACGGSNCSGAYSAFVGNTFLSSPVSAPFTQILGTNKLGWPNNTSSWTATPINLAAGNQFDDPMRGVGQPPIPATASTACPVTVCTNNGGVPASLTGGNNASNPLIIPSGSYFTTGCSGTGCKATANGNPVTLGSGYFEFQDSAGPNSFGTFIFSGGLSISNNSHVTFGPGMYILAGSNQSCSNTPCPEISVSPGAQICDGALHNPFCGSLFDDQATNAGEIFVFTDMNYPSLSSYLPAGVSGLTYGQAGFTLTGTGSTAVYLHGLNAASASLPSNLQPFTPIMFWQDQGNSNVKYTSKGFVDSSCGSLDSPCSNPNVSSTSLSPQMNLTFGFRDPFFPTQASGLYSGAVYIPRGGWLNVQMDSSFGPAPEHVQVVSGAAIIQPSQFSFLNPLILEQLTTNPAPLSHIASALVE